MAQPKNSILTDYSMTKLSALVERTGTGAPHLVELALDALTDALDKQDEYSDQAARELDEMIGATMMEIDCVDSAASSPRPAPERPWIGVDTCPENVRDVELLVDGKIRRGWHSLDWLVYSTDDYNPLICEQCAPTAWREIGGEQ